MHFFNWQKLKVLLKIMLKVCGIVIQYENMISM